MTAVRYKAEVGCPGECAGRARAVWGPLLAVLSAMLFAMAAWFPAGAQERDTPMGTSVRIRVDKTQVGMGRSVAVEARVSGVNGAPAQGALLLPYVNGKRWGAHDYADAEGFATFHIPLPNPGVAKIQVEAWNSGVSHSEQWIWAPESRENQEVCVQSSFELDSVPSRARMWVAVDDLADIHINGRAALHYQGFDNLDPADVTASLRPGSNVISATVRNGAGPAGLLLLLELAAASGTRYFSTDGNWSAHMTPPKRWPEALASGGTPVIPLGGPDAAPWVSLLKTWPGLSESRAHLFAGHRLAAGANVSDPVQVDVVWRELEPIRGDGGHLIGSQWEPFCTPHHNDWRTAQAVPLVGFYRSWDRDVLRQHMIWLAESGVDFLLADWAGATAWGEDDYANRGEAANEMLHTTTVALDVLATMRDEGLPYPRMVLITFLNNGPSTSVSGLNGNIAWIYNNYLRNPRFEDLFLDYLGKPLLLVFNGGGPAAYRNGELDSVDDEHFTIRYMSAQHDHNRNNEAGYWSWMDGSLEPTVTLYEGKPEAMTVSVAFFSLGMWLGEGAYGRRGGRTYLESFGSALRHRPRFVVLHQFNEFAGQYEGHGYGADGSLYGDSYSVELSDDFEPVSLTTPAYRGKGGWGFYYLNLTRALVDLYRQPEPATTVVVVSSPSRNDILTSDRCLVEWAWVGKPPKTFSIAVNGEAVHRDIQGASRELDLRGFADGPLTIRVTAEGTQSRYLLSHTEDALPLDDPVAAFAEVELTLQRASASKEPSPSGNGAAHGRDQKGARAMNAEERAKQQIPRIKRLIEENGAKHYEKLGIDYYSSYGENLYDWEHYFDTIALAYFLPDTYAVNGLRMFLHNQRQDGFIPRHIRGTERKAAMPDALSEFERVGRAWEMYESEEHCKPFLCQSALLIARARGDVSWLSQTEFEQLKRYLDHWLTAWDPDGNGLSVWSSAAHSGADTQHRRMGSWRGRFCEGVDLNCYLYRECLAAAALAAALGRGGDAAHFGAAALRKSEKIQDLLWCEEEGFFFDRDARTGKRIDVKTAATFIPLWAGVATERQARILVERHLKNPDEFWTPFPVAAYARSEPDYAQRYVPPPGSDMVHSLIPDHANWNGGMWPHWNYLIAHGLANYGYKAEAQHIAARFVEATQCEGGPYEWYNAETGQGLGVHPFWAGASILGVILGTELNLGFEPASIGDIVDALDFSQVRARLGI